MILAQQSGERVEATPHARAKCPQCSEEVIAKCGEINVWHWAHKADFDCDNWAKHETVWHRDWKRLFPIEWREVIVGNHRADVKTPHQVIEFQNSPIASTEIREREIFYGSMIWIVAAGNYRHQIDIRNKDTHFTFRWKHPRKSWWAATRPVFLDLEDGMIFEIRKVYRNTPCGGWGYLQWKHRFLSTLLQPDETHDVLFAL